MPTYDYECRNCQHSFEIFQKMTDDLLTTCPKCKGSLKRLIGAGAGIIFKGSGFYYTDYVKNQPSSNTPSSSKKTPSPDKSASTTDKPKSTKKAE